MPRALRTLIAISVVSFGMSSVAAAQMAVLPPTELHVSEMRGNRVTLRWTAPGGGLMPTGYIVEATGLAPATVATAQPILTIDAPAGVYFARVRTQSGGLISGPSNDIAVFVGVPAAPSPPENVMAVVSGTTVTLAWRNSFAGGEPTSLVFEIGGALATSLTSAVTDTLTFTDVPTGAYTVTMRALNGAGISFPSHPLIVTVPSACSGAPLPPTDFLAYNLGSTIFVVWEPPSEGPAPTAYTVQVTGSLVASVTTARRQLSQHLGPGSYTISVAAVNPCGTSAPTASQTVPSASATGSALQLLTIDSEHVARVRESLSRGDPQFARALTSLEVDAARALGLAPVSVMDKGIAPPSGDKHDYMSQAPYWWPDPSKPDGRPYILRDGERNPEISLITDRDNLGRLRTAVTSLGLAFHFTGREEYAQHAARLVRAWFLDPATRMNPHLSYGQGIPGITTGRGAGIIETRLIPDILDGVTLLRGSEAWTLSDDAALKAWCRAYLQWLLESSLGRDAATRGNNHETWYDVQVAALALYTGQAELARTLLRGSRATIGRQIEPDGSQPRELERTRAWDYSIFNLSAFLHLAALGDRVGVDLWNRRTADGRSLRAAVDYLVPFATGARRFPYRQIGGFRAAELHAVLRRAAVGWNEPAYREIARQIGGGTRRLELTFP